MEKSFDVKNPKLFKRFVVFMRTMGWFSGDALDDYEILMECVYNDLEILDRRFLERFPYRYVEAR